MGGGFASSSTSVRYCCYDIFCSRPTRAFYLFFLLVLLISIGIFCIFLPATVKQLQQGGIVQQVPYGSPYASSSQASEFLNTSTTFDYYFWNITNLRDVLLNGVEIQMKEVGPIPITKWRYKTEVTYSADKTEVSYLLVFLFSLPTDSQSLSYLNSPIVTVNPLYFGLLAQIGQNLQKNSGLPVTGMPSLSENNLLFAPVPGANPPLFGQQIQKKAFPLLASTFLDPAGSLLQALRVLSVGAYYQAAQATFESNLGKTAQDVLLDWGSAGNTSSFYPASFSQAATAGAGKPVFPNFELPAALSSYATGGQSALLVQAGTLLSTTNPWGLFSSSTACNVTQIPLVTTCGTIAWLTALQLYSEGQSSSQAFAAYSLALIKGPYPLLSPNYVLTSVDLAMMLGYLGNIAQYTTASPTLDQTFYESVIVGVVNNALTTIGHPFFNNAQFYVANYSDIGALQWGTGYLTTILSNNAVLINAGLPTSVISLLPSVAPDPNNPQPPEFAAAISPLAAPFGSYIASGIYPPLPPYPTPGVTNAQAMPAVIGVRAATALLNTLAADPSFSIYLEVILPFLNQLSTPNAVPWSTFVLFLSQNPAFQPLVPFLQNADFASLFTFSPPQYFMFGATGYAAYYPLALGAYFASYLGGSAVSGQLYHNVKYPFLSPGDIDAFGIPLINPNPAPGVAPQGLSMFTMQTPYNFLFGYQELALGQQIPGIIGNASQLVKDMSVPEVVGVADQTQVAAQLQQFYQVETGRTDVETTGTIIRYQGFASLMTNCDYIDPLNVNNCTQNPFTNFNTWPQKEYVGGNTDGNTIAPSFSSSGPLQPSISLWVDEARRNALLNNTQTIDSVKGIDTFRYTLDPRFLTGINGSNPLRDNYYSKSLRTGITNIITVQSGVPLVLSHPHFLYGDSNFQNQVGGFSPDPNLHDTFIDIEPWTGKSFNLHKRLQGNYFLYKNFAGNSDFPSQSFTLTTVFNKIFSYADPTNTLGLPLPYFWADENAVINDNDASSFKNSFQTIPNTMNIIQIVGPIVCFLLALLVLYFFVKYIKTSDEMGGWYAVGGGSTGTGGGSSTALTSVRKASSNADLEVSPLHHQVSF